LEKGREAEVKAHRVEALRLYQALFEKTPNFEYRQRIDELSAPTEPTTSEADDAAAE
jgi:hypothetical protein